jgi:hypothetical protein
MSRFLGDLLSGAADRGLPPLACAGLFALFALTLLAWTGLALTRWGLPQHWPFLQRAALVVVSIGGSAAWWWVNGSVEGPSIVPITHNHGLTTGDLFVGPALMLAALLCTIEAGPQLRRLH